MVFIVNVISNTPRYSAERKSFREARKSRFPKKTGVTDAPPPDSFIMFPGRKHWPLSRKHYGNNNTGDCEQRASTSH